MWFQNVDQIKCFRIDPQIPKSYAYVVYNWLKYKDSIEILVCITSKMTGFVL